jgi:hypothetical protein
LPGRFFSTEGRKRPAEHSGYRAERLDSTEAGQQLLGSPSQGAAEKTVSPDGHDASSLHGREDENPSAPTPPDQGDAIQTTWLAWAWVQVVCGVCLGIMFGLFAWGALGLADRIWQWLDSPR